MHACIMHIGAIPACLNLEVGDRGGGGGGGERYPGISTKIEGFQSINLSMQDLPSLG